MPNYVGSNENFLENVKQSQRCQRNWDYDVDIDIDTVNYLLDVGYNMPTKQNQDSIQIITFRNRHKIELLSSRAYNEKAFDQKNSGHYHNPQANAPLVFAFILRPDMVKNGAKDHIGVECGLAAGAIALAANNMGLRTGFCACFDQGGFDFSDKINLSNNKFDPKDIHLLLGVGHPVKDKPYNIGNKGVGYYIDRESHMNVRVNPDQTRPFPTYNKGGNEYNSNHMSPEEKRIIL
ncbi:MAG: hypothetical protein ACR2MS_06065 [Weeksellaceae bacterium]